MYNLYFNYSEKRPELKSLPPDLLNISLPLSLTIVHGNPTKLVPNSSTLDQTKNVVLIERVASGTKEKIHSLLETHLAFELLDNYDNKIKVKR